MIFFSEVVSRRKLKGAEWKIYLKYLRYMMDASNNCRRTMAKDTEIELNKYRGVEGEVSEEEGERNFERGMTVLFKMLVPKVFKTEREAELAAMAYVDGDKLFQQVERYGLSHEQLNEYVAKLE